MEAGTEWCENKQWIESAGFEVVYWPGAGRNPKCDRGKVYQFMNPSWNEPQLMRLADIHPMANIANLYFREA